MSNQPRFLSEQAGEAADRNAAWETAMGAAPDRFHGVKTEVMIREADALLAESAKLRGRIFRHTKSNEPILGANKTTYAHFVKTVWVLSNTNLHPKDFEAEFGADLTRMFHPVRIRNGSGA